MPCTIYHPERIHTQLDILRKKRDSSCRGTHRSRICANQRPCTQYSREALVAYFSGSNGTSQPAQASMHGLFLNLVQHNPFPSDRSLYVIRFLWAVIYALVVYITYLAGSSSSRSSSSSSSSNVYLLCGVPIQ